jgi:hypothetical protein
VWRFAELQPVAALRSVGAHQARDMTGLRLLSHGPVRRFAR